MFHLLPMRLGSYSKTVICLRVTLQLVHKNIFVAVAIYKLVVLGQRYIVSFFSLAGAAGRALGFLLSLLFTRSSQGNTSYRHLLAVRSLRLINFGYFRLVILDIRLKFWIVFVFVLFQMVQVFSFVFDLGFF